MTLLGPFPRILGEASPATSWVPQLSLFSSSVFLAEEMVWLKKGVLCPFFGCFVDYNIFRQFYFQEMDVVLRIPPLISKALDTLCLEISINRSDENSLGLIEILGWRVESEISDEQFTELYKNWLQSKKITSLTAARQEDTYSKINLLHKLPQFFLNYTQIIKCLEILNEQYNDQYLKRIRTPKSLNQLESVFSYLDYEGVIHLRYSQLLFLYMAITPKQSYNNQNVFKMEFGNFRKNLGEVQGKVCLRTFKNYLSTLPQALLTNLTKSLLRIQHKLNLPDHLPDIFSQSLDHWYGTSNFKYQFREGKQKLELYRRILEEYDYLFFNLNDPERIYAELELGYGYQQMSFYDITISMVKQLHRHINSNVNKYITWYFGSTRPIKVASKLSFREASRESKSSRSNFRMSPIKHSSSVQKIKIGTGRLLDKSSIQKLSRSIDELNMKSSRRRLPVQHIVKKGTSRTPAEYRILEEMNLFKGRTIESFESVMRRLKKKK